MPVSRARQAGVNLVFKRQRLFSHYLSQFLRVLEAGDRFDGDCVRHHALPFEPSVPEICQLAHQSAGPVRALGLPYQALGFG